jgi:chromosome segregation ATPase
MANKTPPSPANTEPPAHTPPMLQRDEAPVVASLQMATDVLDRLAVQYTGITAASEILKQLGSMSQQVAERQARKTHLDAAIHQAQADLDAATKRAAEITAAVDAQASEVVAAVEQMRAQADIERTQMLEQAAAEAREIVAQANESAAQTAGQAKTELVKAQRDLADAYALQIAVSNSTAEIQMQYDALQAKIEAARARAREAFGG